MKFTINLGYVPYKFLLIFIFLCWHQFFYLFAFSESIDALLRVDNLVPIAAFISIICTLFIILFKNKYFKKYNKLFIYFVSLTIAMGIVIVYSMAKYAHQSYFHTLKGAAVYFMPFVSVIVILYLESGGTVGRLLSIVNAFSFLWYLLVIMQVIYYKNNGAFFLDYGTYMKQYFNQGKYGLRIGMHVFGNIAILYNLVNIRYTKRFIKIWHFINFILGLYCFIFIQQTRSLFFYIFFCIAVYIFVSPDKSAKTRILQFTAMVFALYVVAFTNIINSYIESFSLQGDNAFSTSTRLYAVQYYISCFLKNPFVGNGLADGGKESYYYSVEHGSAGIAYYSDVGLIGVLANLGLVTIVVYIIPMVRMIKIWIRTHKFMETRMEIFSLLTLVYFVITAITYSLVIGRNSLLFAIAIGLFEYVNVKYRNAGA